MLTLKYLLMLAGFGIFATAAGIVAYDIYRALQLYWLLDGTEARDPETSMRTRVDTRRPFGPVRWRYACQLALVGLLPLLLALSVTVVPDGSAAILVSQFSGVRPGTLYPGIHFIAPLVDNVILYDTRERVYTTAASETVKTASKSAPEVLVVQAREGLNIGLAVTVRYRLDPSKLTTIHQNLPQPVDEQVVGPVVSSIYRQICPSYETRAIFAVKREELRVKASDAIKAQLASDGIVVREVLLRDIQLPEEYAKGLEGLLLKEQENERLTTEQDIKLKEVRIAELDSEAQKARDVKNAESQAQVRVLQAKAEADAMQYTLPLKQKQIEQSKLEAQARKEATLQNAEAAAQAKIIDSKAELERQHNLSDAEANRIRVTAAADSERMRFEAEVLKQNPMLIQKIIAERLSDKLQIMMVPMDGKNFFAADVMRSAFSGGLGNSGGSANDGGDEADLKLAPVATATAQRKSNKRP
jgi:regulator of protease activity HflC (stomatin/prohibitin superfamily)